MTMQVEELIVMQTGVVFELDCVLSRYKAPRLQGHVFGFGLFHFFDSTRALANIYII